MFEHTSQQKVRKIMFPMRLNVGLVTVLSCFALLLGLLALTGIASAHSAQAQTSASACTTSCSPNAKQTPPPPSQVVNTVEDYYNAVERQEYATAYTYLNHQSVRFQTLAAYSKSALSLDQTAGTLTDYTIASTSITNGIATVIVDRTRGGKTAEIFVEVEQVGGNWKINAIVPGWSIPS
jgi:hypothetical protein